MILCAVQCKKKTFEESEYAHIKIIRHIYKIKDRILLLNLMWITIHLKLQTLAVSRFHIAFFLSRGRMIHAVSRDVETRMRKFGTTEI